MIGHLPGTLADRSISIALKRKRADEPVESFRYDHTEELDQLARMCARWAADNIERLRQADPAVPASLYNRPADNWRPLLAIADLAAGEWPGRARAIAAAIVNDDDAKRVGLLTDIRNIFEEKQVDRIRSADLAAALVAIEGHPWAEHGKAGRPLSANNLARMLASDHISPQQIRFGIESDNTGRGYELKQFADAFARYLPPPTPNPTETLKQPEDSCGSQPDSQLKQADEMFQLENAENPSVSTSCFSVSVEKGGEPQKSERVRVRL
jgi:hypothetical protein